MKFFYPGRIESLSVGYWGGRKTGEPWENPKSKARTNSKLNPHMARGRNRTRPTLVGGAHSYHCIPVQCKQTFTKEWSGVVDLIRPSFGQEPYWILNWSTVNFTNRFHVAVRLFSNRSQTTLKCGKSKKSGTRGDNRVCHWCSYRMLTSSVINYYTDTWQHGIYSLYTIKKQTTAAFIFQNLSKYSKAGLCPLWRVGKTPFDVICCPYKWSNLIGCYT